MAKINLPIVYSQWDSRWAGLFLGNNTQLPFTFYNYACLLCSQAVVCNYFGKVIDPVELNNKLKEVKGFPAGSGEYVWGSIPKIYKDITEFKTITPDLLSDSQMSEIKQSIDDGFPVVVWIDVNPKTVANDMHWVTIVDYNPADENDFTIADSLGGKVRSLRDYLGWFMPSARKTISGYVVYKGTKPKLDSNSVVLSKDDAERRTHNSEQWIKILGYLGINTDPALTQSDDAQRTIGGFKSRATDLENQLNNTQKELGLANQEIVNLRDKVANLTDDCQKQQSLKDAEIKALSETAKGFEKLRGEYTATIDGLRGDLRELQKQVGGRDLLIKELQIKLEQAQKPQSVKVNLLLAFIKKLFGK